MQKLTVMGVELLNFKTSINKINEMNLTSLQSWTSLDLLWSQNNHQNSILKASSTIVISSLFPEKIKMSSLLVIEQQTENNTNILLKVI